MHRIIESYMNTYCDETGIDRAFDESKKFEFFANYCVIRSFYPEDFGVENITSEEDDSGIDGICYIIDGEIATTPSEAEIIFKRPKKSMPVDIYFIQSKTSDTYDRGDILKFGNGIKDFLSESPQLPEGDFIKQQRLIFDSLVTNVSKIQSGRANIHLKYICTSNNQIASEIAATRLSIIEDIEKTGYFSSVTFDYIGLEELITLWDKTRNTITAIIPTKQLSPYPEMPGVSEAYIAIVPLKSFVECVLMDSEHKMRTHVFEENVRAFLGAENPVNKQIKNSILNTNSQKQFAILNNGVTIISPDVKVQNDRISIEDYQIVNGCQTSNVLYENYDKLLPESMITIKVIEATDPDVIADVVKATNSQSIVEDSQFLSYANIIRRLERYFEATQDIPGEETKLYFERRNGQYNNFDIPKRRIFSISETCRAVGAMFLHKPEMAYRYPTKMIYNMYDQLINDKNKEIIYYTAARTLYRFKLLTSNGRIPSKYNIYKWHILMILGIVANGKSMPSIQNKKIERYCKSIIAICSQPDEDCLELFRKATNVLDEVGLKNTRDEIRSLAYTQTILEYCHTRAV